MHSRFLYGIKYSSKHSKKRRNISKLRNKARIKTRYILCSLNLNLINLTKAMKILAKAEKKYNGMIAELVICSLLLSISF